MSFDGTCLVWKRQAPTTTGELSWDLAATLEGHENEVHFGRVHDDEDAAASTGLCK